MRAINIAIVTIILLLSTLVSYADNVNLKLAVYKSPQCGCCDKWVTHLENSNFQIYTKSLDDPEVNEIKSKIKNMSQYLSCHTGVYKNKYIFEGHIPAKFIIQFLVEKPEGAIGLAVPAMPVGTPGMEVGDKFSPYDVLLIKDDGTHEIYAHVTNYDEQF